MRKCIAWFVFLFFVTLPVAAMAQVPERPAQASFKGVEMLSWKDAETGTWMFSLLPGTNRNKTEAEIRSASDAISVISDLQRRFESLALDEQVFWASPNPEAFPYPPADVVERIGKIAVAAKVRLVITP